MIDVVPIPAGDRRGRAGHLGRHQGPARAPRSTGTRPPSRRRGTAELYRRLPEPRRAAGRARALAGRSAGGAGRRRARARGRLRVPVSRAHAHGAARLRGPARRGRVRGVGRLAVADARPAWRWPRSLGLPPDKVRLHTMLAGGSFGRRSTPRSDVAGRGGQHRPGARRRAADQGRVDPRGRRAGRLLPAALRAPAARGAGRGRPHRGVGAPDRGAVHRHGDAAGCPSRPGRDRPHLGRGRGQPALCHPEHRGGAAHHRRGHPRPLVALGGQHAYRVLHRDVPGRAGPRRRTRSRGHASRHAAEAVPVTCGVLDLAAAQAGWGQPLPPGRARGVAVHECFGSVVAQVAEVVARRRRAAPASSASSARWTAASR